MLCGPPLTGPPQLFLQKPSAIQQRAIKPLIMMRDTIAQAQSGTGKTATFTIGLLQNIDLSNRDCQALILAPTRELASQIVKVVMAIGDSPPKKGEKFAPSTAPASSIVAALLPKGTMLSDAKTGHVGAVSAVGVGAARDRLPVRRDGRRVGAAQLLARALARRHVRGHRRRLRPGRPLHAPHGRGRPFVRALRR